MGKRSKKQKREGLTGGEPGGVCALTTAKPVAPEDLRGGDFVAVVECTYELPSFLWCGVDVSLMPPDEPVLLRMAPPRAGVPLRVESLCLPFGLVKHPSGRCKSVDFRRCRLVRLDRGYARAAWRAMRKKKSKRF